MELVVSEHAEELRALNSELATRQAALIEARGGEESPTSSRREESSEAKASRLLAKYKARRDEQAKTPCKHFATDNCKQGEKCPFLHGPLK